MRLIENMKMALQQVLRNRLRSGLTLLGTVVGVSTVVAMVSLVEGFRVSERALFLKWGHNLVEFWPPHKDPTRLKRPLVNRDVEILRAECPALTGLSGLIEARPVTVRYGGRKLTSRLKGYAPSYLSLRDLEVGLGRSFTEAEARSKSMVCALGAGTARGLFGNDVPVGQTIEVLWEGRQLRFQVLGVLKEKGNYDSIDNAIYAPLSTVQQRVLGCGDRIWCMHGEAATLEDTAIAAAQGARAAKLHNIPVESWSLKAQFEKDARLSRDLKLLFGGVGAVIIVVSGLGLLNLMLVSLAQRRWEVGLRKALGASDQDIVVQFLAEAASVSLLAGVIALPVALIAAYAAARYLEFPVIISPWLVVSTEVIVVAVGVAAGVIPAQRAARLTPRETLRGA